MNASPASCAIVGHRPQKLPWKDDESNDQCEILKYTLAGIIRGLAEDGVTEFYSGISQGIDCWASEAVLTLRRQSPRTKLHCILPCQGMEEGRSKRDQARCRDILEQASSVVYLDKALREGDMRRRNRYLVEHCDILLAVYDGEDQGGTAEAVAYARSLGRSILILSPMGKAVTFENVRSEA